MVSIGSDSDRPDERPSPTDFETFLPWASGQLETNYTLNITRNVQSKYVSVISKNKKPKAKAKAKTPTDSASSEQVKADVPTDSNIEDEIKEETPIYLETIYDENDDLVRLKLLKNRHIPRTLFKIISLAIPYHKTLTSFIVNQGLHATAIYEISKFYSTNQITEICLDGTYLREANYHILLDNNIIKHFSLSKCNITDVVVKTIASKLKSSSPASTSLSVLNLSTNRITDIGAKYLAEMLRSNRQLSYLNLADNKITDEGAKSIFNTLTKFALTSEETLDRSRNLISYLKEKKELVRETIKELNRSDDDKKSSKKKTAKSVRKKLDKDISVDIKSYHSVEGNLFERAEVIAETILGPFMNPFGPENTEKGESVLYCLGNNTMSYLNLAFNNLTYYSLKKLCDVLKSQNIASRKPKGLINIRIEGNYLPESCAEYQTIDDLLLTGLSNVKQVETIKRRGTITSARINN